MEYIDKNGETHHLENDSKFLNIIGNNDVVTILHFSKKIKRIVIENNNNLTSIEKFPANLDELYIKNNVQLESLYIPDVRIKLEIHDNPKLTNIHELIEKFKTTRFYNATFPVIKVEAEESDFDSDISIGSDLNDVDLNIENWTFTTNIDEYRSSPSYLRGNSKYLISYKEYNGYSYPIITIPKGTILYNYAKGLNFRLKDKYHNIYNLEEGAELESQLKFFFPVPYAAKIGIDTAYNISNIVVTNYDIQLLCLLSPAPQSNETLRSYEKHLVTNAMFTGQNYYDNGFTSKCDTFDHDLCINLNMMKEMNIQGYISISKMDSISNGEIWHKNMDKESMKTYKKYIEEYLFNSCLSSIYKENNNLDYINEKLSIKLPPDLKHRMFGVPEIVLVPLRTEYFYNINQDKIITAFNNIQSDGEFEDKESEINIIFKNMFNYQVLNICALSELKDYLEQIEHNILMNKQCHMLQLFSPELVIKEISTNLRYEKLNFDDVNYVLSYLKTNDKNPYCAFETVSYHLLKDQTGGRRKTLKLSRRRFGNTRRFRKNRRNNLFTKSFRSYIKLAGGGDNDGKQIVFEKTKGGIPIVYTIDAKPPSGSL